MPSHSAFRSAGAVIAIGRSRLSANAMWVLAERLANSLLSLVAIVLITRMLGPEDYGHFAFSTSVVAIALATGHLGLDGLLLKMLIEQPGQQEQLLGSVTLMKAAVYAPVTVAIVIYAFANATHTHDENMLLSVMAMLQLVVPLASSSMTWLSAHEAFRSTAIVRVAAVLAGTLAKLALIAAGLGIVEVGIAHAAMFLLEMLLLYALLRMNGGPPLLRWRFSGRASMDMLGQSGFVFAGTVFALIYMNTDVIVLRYMAGPEAVGLYALVPQIVLAAQLLPYAITLSAFPSMVKQQTSDPAGFASASRRFALLLFMLGLLTCGGAALLAPVLIVAVFGDQYAASVPTLQIASLALPFLFLRQLTTKLFICTETSRHFAAVEGIALAVNVAALMTLIPILGSRGAAIAMILTFATSILLSSNLFRRAGPMAEPSGEM